MNFFYFNNALIYKVTFDATLNNVTPLNIFFNWMRILKNPPYVRLYYLFIFSMLTKIQGNQRLITISSIDCLNSNFYNLK